VRLTSGNKTPSRSGDVQPSRICGYILSGSGYLFNVITWWIYDCLFEIIIGWK